MFNRRPKYIPNQPPMILPRSQWLGISSRGMPHHYLNYPNPQIYRDYLHDESRRMTSSWDNSIERIRNRRTEERNNIQKEKTEQDQNIVRDLKEKQRRYQQEQTENIENSMRQLKPGSLALKRAKLLTDVLQVQNEQRQNNILQSIQNRQNLAQNDYEFSIQNREWISDQQSRDKQRQIRVANYKTDLQNAISQNESNRLRRMEQMQKENLDMQRSMDEHCFREVEREKREMERRRQQLRQTATDAMAMAEKRRLRDQMQEEISDKLNQIFTDGHNLQKEITQSEMHQMKKSQNHRQSLVWSQMNSTFKESEEQRMINEENVLFNANLSYAGKLEEKDRVELDRKRQLKAQRIQYHLEEMEREKEQKMKKDRIFMESVINRLLNDKISSKYGAQERERKIKSNQALRTELMRQWEEKQATANRIKAETMAFTNRNCDYSNDHQEFIEFASELIEKAKHENKSLLPLKSAVKEYKEENFVEEKPLLPHLVVKDPAVAYEKKRNQTQGKIKYNIEQLKALMK